MYVDMYSGIGIEKPSSECIQRWAGIWGSEESYSNRVIKT